MGYENISNRHINISENSSNKIFLELSSYNLPISLSFLDFSAGFRENQDDFKKRGYVYFLWKHPLIGWLSESDRARILKEESGNIIIKALEQLSDTRKMYLGRMLINEEVPDINSKYPYFISRASLECENTIISFDDFLFDVAGISDRLAFWNFEGKIYENRAVIESYVSHAVDFFNRYEGNESPVFADSLGFLRYEMVKQWKGYTGKENPSTDEIILQGIMAIEELKICYHEKTHIEGGDEFQALLSEFEYQGKDGRQSIKPLLEIYVMTTDRNHPYYEIAIKVKENLGIDFKGLR